MKSLNHVCRSNLADFYCNFTLYLYNSQSVTCLKISHILQVETTADCSAGQRFAVSPRNTHATLDYMNQTFLHLKVFSLQVVESNGLVNGGQVRNVPRVYFYIYDAQKCFGFVGFLLKIVLLNLLPTGKHSSFRKQRNLYTHEAKVPWTFSVTNIFAQFAPDLVI